MQDQYISLNPERTASEEKSIRSALYSQRLIECQGGKASILVGMQWGVTATLLTLNMLNSQGFKAMPFTPSKT